MSGRPVVAAILALVATTAAPSEAAARRRAKPKPTPAAVASADPVRQARLFGELGERVKAYVELHKKAQDELPKLKDESSPTAIAAHQQVLAQKIRARRAGAKQGDFLVKELQPVLRGILHREFKASPPAKEEIKDENPKSETPAKPVPVAVNATYKPGASLSTVTPNILLKLPKLPDEILEYRFVGKTLIVRDVVAELIVDYMTEAMP